MIGQYLSNNNENATVAFCQKIWHPNGAQDERKLNDSVGTRKQCIQFAVATPRMEWEMIREPK
jgi:hypothetical protein